MQTVYLLYITGLMVFDVLFKAYITTGPFMSIDFTRGNGCVKGYYFLKKQMKAASGEGKTLKRTIKGLHYRVQEDP